MTLPKPALSRQPRSGPLVDRFARVHTYLRVSLTDRCNLKCTYCVPAEVVAPQPRDELLTFEEITRIVRVFVDLGVRRIRLTGGEPTLRRDLPALVASLAGLGLDDLAMTTNGLTLPRLADPLARAGLQRVNVSLDAVHADTFRELTGGGDVGRVLAGIEAAVDAGLVPVKVNAVAIRGVTETEAPRLVRWASRWPEHVVVRFIEEMPFETSRRRHLSAARLREILARDHLLTPLGDERGGPASRWRVAGSGQEVGFIAPMTEHFCHRCNRLRLEADGHLRTCLSRDDTPSLRDLLRAGATDDDLAAAIRGMVWGKVAGHEAHLPGGQAFEGVMTRIGG